MLSTHHSSGDGRGPMRIGGVGVGRIGSVHVHNLAGMIPAGTLLIYETDPAEAGKAAAEVNGSVRPTAEAADANALVVVTAAGTPDGSRAARRR